MQRMFHNMATHARWMFLLCFLPPVAANTWMMFVSNPVFDFTVPAYCVMIAGAYLIIWQHRLISLTPVAAKSVFDSMSHPVYVNAPGGDCVYTTGQSPRDGHAYRVVETALEDGNVLVMHIDVTEQHALLTQLSAQKTERTRVQEQLSHQAQILARQSETAAELAAQQQRIEIMALLNNEVRDNLEALRIHTERSAASPTSDNLMEGKRLASVTLELVRRIVSDMKRGTQDGF
jgi:hypothetical protein